MKMVVCSLHYLMKLNMADLKVPEPESEDVVCIKRRKKNDKREIDISGMEKEEPIMHELPEKELRELFGDRWKRLPDEVYYRVRCVPA